MDYQTIVYVVLSSVISCIQHIQLYIVILCIRHIQLYIVILSIRHIQLYIVILCIRHIQLYIVMLCIRHIQLYTVNTDLTHSPPQATFVTCHRRTVNLQASMHIRSTVDKSMISYFTYLLIGYLSDQTSRRLRLIRSYIVRIWHKTHINTHAH